MVGFYVVPEDKKRFCRCFVVQGVTGVGWEIPFLFHALRSDILFDGVPCLAS